MAPAAAKSSVVIMVACAAGWGGACARGLPLGPGTQDVSVDSATFVDSSMAAPDHGVVGQDSVIADARLEVSLDATSDVSTTDAGPCLAIRGTYPFTTMADTTGGIPFDRGWPSVGTSNCPLSIPPSDVTRGTPSRQFHFCNPSSAPVRFSLAVHASYDVWTAVYQGDEVPTDVLQCVAMNDDDRRPGRSTTDSYVPEVTLAPGAVVTVVVAGITNATQNRGPFELTATPL